MTLPLSIVVVMPAYNESDGICDFIAEIAESFNSLNIPTSFCVQDDCSTDNSIERLYSLRKTAHLNVNVKKNDSNRGHGPTSLAALRAGISSGATWILHVDGDGQFTGQDLRRIVELGLATGDAVVGVRKSRMDPWFRKVLTRLLRQYLKLICQTRSIYDPNSPVRFEHCSSLKQKLEQIPVDAVIPSIWWTVISVRSRQNTQYLNISSLERRGQGGSGSMWGRNRIRFLPNRRLLVFCGHALKESLKIW